MTVLYAAGVPLALLFLSVGLGHFREEQRFVGIMLGLPFQRFHVLANRVTGVAELVGGAALLLRPAAGAPFRSSLAPQ